MRPITARDLMNPEVLTVETSMLVRDLAAFLVDNEISGAPVEDAEGRLVGVVSLVDLAASQIDDERLTVAEIMTPALYTIDENATVSEVASTMLDGHVHRLLVTGEKPDSVVGIVSTSDLLGLLVEES